MEMDLNTNMKTQLLKLCIGQPTPPPPSLEAERRGERRHPRREERRHEATRPGSAPSPLPLAPAPPPPSLVAERRGGRQPARREGCRHEATRPSSAPSPRRWRPRPRRLASRPSSAAAPSRRWMATTRRCFGPLSGRRRSPPHPGGGTGRLAAPPRGCGLLLPRPRLAHPAAPLE